jgi:uncharacterized protein YoaH (UPF0181 family)
MTEEMQKQMVEAVEKAAAEGKSSDELMAIINSWLAKAEEAEKEESCKK